LLGAASGDKLHIADLALEQADRPQNEIHLNPIHFCVEGRFLKDECAVGMNLHDSILLYRSWPKELSFRTANDWAKREEDRKLVVQNFIKAIDDAEPNDFCPETLKCRDA
jgi:hypothetical protein